MPICSSCGAAAQPGEQFCQQCGQRLAPEAYSASAAADSTPEDAVERNAETPAIAAAGQLIIRRMPPADDPEAAPGEPYEVALDGSNVAIGRSPSCDIVLDGDQLVSRRHALLRHDGEHYAIVDLGSSNGTYVNGVEIRENTPLTDGDRISIGEHELLFSTAPASPSASFAGAQTARVGVPAPATAMAGSAGASAAANKSTSNGYTADAPSGTLAGEERATQEVAAVVGSARATSEKLASVASQANDQNAAEEQDQEPRGPYAASPDEPHPFSQAVIEHAPTSQPGAARLTLGQVQEISAELRHLAEMSESLALRLDEEMQRAEERGAALRATHDRLSALIEQLGAPLSADAAMETGSTGAASVHEDSGDLGELILVARQAAENPRHLDYLARLGERAGEIADVLEARQQRQQAPQAPDQAEHVRAELKSLRDWLDAQV